MVHDHHRLLRDRVTKRIKPGNHHTRVDRLFNHRGMHIMVAIHTPSPIDPPLAPGRQLDDALGLLPGVGKRGIKRKASFIKVIESDRPLVLVCL